ncbi:MAG: ubiquinol-cytochrome c reductase iron-sulfur subunit [Daejeonella sp.]|uniref:QcrA and Rieske domain-containing protein n=1 Tax=Daejeonella sp. JGW-45 TaxID=3034148 RepID=UPI0023EB309A|nr:Rieske (2Fe-2S) protein [Daejeonella sp. JGW-45]
MKRTEFLNTLGIGLAAACTGCLASCGKGGEATPGGGAVIPPPVPPAGVNFTLDLNTELKTVGESKTNSGVIVVRLAASNVPASFTAVQVACTHEGTSIAFNTNQGNFVCPNHGSVFNSTGAVTTGPATTNLKKYNIAVSGTTLTVTG